MTKVCSKCGIEKDASEFAKRKQSIDGLAHICKFCKAEYDRERRKKPEVRKRKRELDAVWRQNGGLEYFKEYYQIHKTKMLSDSRQWALDHPEEMRQYRSKWSEKDKAENPERATIYCRKKREEDLQFRLRDALRARLNAAIKSEFKGGSAVRDLGCSIPEFKAHLESKFQEGMTWDNWGKGLGKWNIDHIIPLAAFDLTNRQHVVLACYYLNLQPLWSEDNARKGDKLDF